MANYNRSNESNENNYTESNNCNETNQCNESDNYNESNCGGKNQKTSNKCSSESDSLSRDEALTKELTGGSDHE